MFKNQSTATVLFQQSDRSDLQFQAADKSCDELAPQNQALSFPWFSLFCITDSRS